MTDEERLAATIVLAVKAATGPLLERIAVLEARATEAVGRPIITNELWETMTSFVESTRARLDWVEGRALLPGPAGPAGPAGKDGAPGANGKDGTPGRDGVDGVSVMGLKGDDGADGKDGAPGRDGRDALPMPGPAGRDGIDGKDGKDGVSFEDIGFETDADGHLWITAVRGDIRKSARVPGHVNRGLWKEGVSYLLGDGVTWAGSYWTAQADTSEKPGDGATAWRMAVRRGDQGKAGRPGDKGDPGLKGDKGDPGRWS
jgi:integrin beta 3